MLSLAVHEFRTPASVVGGYLRMLQRDSEPLSDRQRKMIDEAAKSCARLVEIVSELSEVGKLDSGRTTLTTSPFDLFALVFELAGELAGSVHEPESREVRLTAEGQAAGAPMTGDPTRLRSAIHAIVRAILREQPSATHVVADCRVEDRDGRRAAVIVVAAEGAVQDAYGRPRVVFDDKRGGLGLALPIARRIIAAHGGAVWAPAAAQPPQVETARGVAIIIMPLE
jgi:signal transduction histidine kinase